MATINTKYPFVGSIETRQGGRDENQDNAGFIDTPLGLLVVVCDGMGGGPGGRTASLMAVETICDALDNVVERTPRRDALRYAIEKANDAIYSKAKEVPELQGMGTTVAAIIINERSVMIAHVGDSRIYQLRKGSIVYRSADHSLVASMIREKELTEEEARNHPRSNVITRALGIRPEVEAEFDEVPFLRGDRFVLCSDGIWGAMPQPELIKRFSRVMGIEELTSTMTNEIDQMGFQAGGGHDNMTLALLDVTFDSIKAKRTLLSKLTYYMVGIALILLIFVIYVNLFVSPKHKEPLVTNYDTTAKDKQKGSIEVPKSTTSKQIITLVEEMSPETALVHKQDFCPSFSPKNNETDENNVTQVFQGQSVTDIKKGEISKLIKQMKSDMESLKKEKKTKRKNYVLKHISPHVANLCKIMDDTSHVKEGELKRLTNINRMVKVKVEQGRGGYNYDEVAWYTNNSSIDSLIKYLMYLEN